jgi:hypothetical protein
MADDETYRAPRRQTPHPDKTPISPYDEQALNNLPSTEFKRTLIAIAKKIRTTEAQLETELQRLNKPTRGNLLNLHIGVDRLIVHEPASVPAARRASSAQSNLQTYYRRWAKLCERHLAAINNERSANN